MKKAFTSLKVMCMAVVLLSLTSRVFAAYPATCSSCQGAGAWCVENGQYNCTDSSDCNLNDGPYDTTDCPSGCTCVAYGPNAGSNTCGNNCIHIVSCNSPPPGDNYCDASAGIKVGDCARNADTGCYWKCNADGFAGPYGNSDCSGTCGTTTPGPTNHNPIGNHDGNPNTAIGINNPQSSGTCHATGWTADPDNLSTRLSVRILDANNQQLGGEVTANAFRGDLLNAGVCTGGSCSFDINLWNLIPHNTDYLYKIQAKDADTGSWVDLSSSPKTINCVQPPSCTVRSTSGQNTVYAGGSMSFALQASNADTSSIYYDLVTSQPATPRGCWQNTVAPSCDWTSGWQNNGILTKDTNGAISGTLSLQFPHEGQFYVVCNAYTQNNTPRCTGNPYCGTNGGWGCYSDTSAWYNCDNASSVLTLTPNPSVDCRGPGSDCMVVTVVPPVGNIHVKAVLLDPDDSRAEITAAPQLKDATLTLSGQPNKIQPDTNTFVEWNSLPVGGYTAGALSPPSGLYSPSLFNNVKMTKGSGFTATNGVTLGNNETASFYFGFRKAALPWFQTRGGDVYSGGGISSPIYNIVDPRKFSLNQIDGLSGSSGIVYYNSFAHFDIGGGAGTEFVSQSANWLSRVSALPSTIHVFDSFYQRLTSKKQSVANSGAQPDCASTVCIYYMKGEMNISSVWSIGADKKIVIMVDEDGGSGGNIAIAATGKIHIDPRGFLALIARHNINFNQNPSSSTDKLQGVFIAGDNLNTGVSPISPPFYAKGIFIAGSNIVLGRNIGDEPSTSTPSETFEYDPNLLMNMPEEMMDFPIVWQEAAP